jgi:hypothetical protein
MRTASASSSPTAHFINSLSLSGLALESSFKHSAMKFRTCGLLSDFFNRAGNAGSEYSAQDDQISRKESIK